MKTENGSPTAKLTEAKLQGFCVAYFRSLGFLTQEEVPFLFKLADLFCFHEETAECIAVEVKIKNWREALNQALVYQMMADRVYVALWHATIKTVDPDMLASKGVGLLAIYASGNVEIVMDASNSPRRMPDFVSRVVATAFPGRASLACLML